MRDPVLEPLKERLKEPYPKDQQRLKVGALFPYNGPYHEYPTWYMKLEPIKVDVVSKVKAIP